MFLAGCTMNTGSKKLQREVGSTFCGAQVVFISGIPPSEIGPLKILDR